jgi:hypothetical protein
VSVRVVDGARSRLAWGEGATPESDLELASGKPQVSVMVVDGARSGLAWGGVPPPDFLEGLAGSLEGGRVCSRGRVLLTS